MATGTDRRFGLTRGGGIAASDIRLGYCSGSLFSGEDARFGWILGAISDSRFGYIEGEGYAAEALRYAYIEGTGTEAQDARFGYVCGRATTSDARWGYVYGTVNACSDARFGYTCGQLLSSSDARFGFTSGQSTVEGDARFSYVTGLEVPYLINEAVSNVIDLGSDCQNYDWYYDFTTATFNDVSGSFYARSAHDSGSLGSYSTALWGRVYQDQMVQAAEVRRYYQFKVSVNAFNPYDFTLHQLSMRAIATHGCVSGVVRHDTGGGLPGARVTAVISGSINIPRQVSADYTGYYKHPALDPGTYIMTASKDGYTSHSRVVSVSAGETKTNIDFHLTIIQGGET